MSKSFSWDNKQMIQNCTGRLPEQNDECCKTEANSNKINKEKKNNNQPLIPNKNNVYSKLDGKQFYYKKK